MTAIGADEVFVGEVTAVSSETPPRRRALRRLRTELIMIGVGLAFVVFSVGYGVSQVH